MAAPDLSFDEIKNAVVRDYLTPLMNLNLPEWNEADFLDFIQRDIEGPGLAIGPEPGPVEELRRQRQEELRRLRQENLPGQVNRLGDLNRIGDVFAGGQVGGNRAQVKVGVMRLLGIVGTPLQILVSNVIDGGLILSQKGYLIYNIPKSDEVVARLCSVFFAKSKGFNVNLGNVDQVAASDVYKSMPASDLETFKSLLLAGLSAAQKSQLEAAFTKWDERVDKIRDALSVNPAMGAQQNIPLKNQYEQPFLNKVSVYSNWNPSLQSAVVRLRTPPQVKNQAGTMAQLRVIAQRGGQKGGNPHAPLYPTVVMNGGSHPLATMEGGAVQPAQVLMDKIKALKEQFRQATNQPFAGPVDAQITAYETAVNDSLKDVQKKLQLLKDATGSLAQFPLGVGVDLQMDENSLKDYAKHADELNKAAEKASRKLDKLSEIKNLLEELVSKVSPATLAK